MTDSTRHSDEAEVTARLKELLKGLSRYIDDASRDQKRMLLMSLEELRPSADSKLSAWLKDYLEENDFSKDIEEATADQKRRVLMLLEDLRASDRRRHVRKPCSIAVTLDGVFTDFIRNISTGGVFIETSEAFQPGKHLALKFSLPDQKEPVEITGQIAWRSPEGVGVRFTAVTKDLREMIESL
jgi:uncharacterized protein (TIGR02266 family)